MKIEQFVRKVITELGNPAQRQSGPARREGLPPTDPRDAGKG